MTRFIVYFFLIFLNFSDLKSENDKEVYKHLNLFGEAFEKIKNNYVEEVSSKELVEAAIEGMLGSLDPHSTFLNTDELNELKVQTKGEFGGLGIEVTLENGFVKVISPIDDTPASRAGILAGDLITHLDDEPVLGMTLSEAVSLMRGKAGSKIKLTVNREDNKTLQIVITRAVIELKAVKAKIQNNIGYIRVSSFNQKVDTQIIKAISKFKKNNNVIGYVLDLRNNPGGLLSQAIRISDFFLDNGEIVSTKSRKASENRKWFAKKGDLTNGKAIIVMINYGSASASEIVAGALKDHKRAILLGENSYGKGSVQSIIPLRNDGAIRLTVAKYYLPSGKSISEVGVSPDIEISEETDEFRIKTETDNQLNYAIKLLNG